MSTDNQLTKHFLESEFVCPCCGECEMDLGFLDNLETLRFEYDYPIKISHGGGYRCGDYNQKVGGAPTSYHPMGSAIDTPTWGLPEGLKFKLLSLAFTMFRGVGIYDRHIHIDNRHEFAMWTGKSK